MADIYCGGWIRQPAGVSRFDKELQTYQTKPSAREKTGPKGAPPAPIAPHGTFNTCHGVGLKPLKSEPGNFHRGNPATNGPDRNLFLELESKRTDRRGANPPEFISAQEEFSIFLNWAKSRVDGFSTRDGKTINRAPGGWA